MSEFVCLTYHRISDSADALRNQFTISIDEFRDGMQLLADNGKVAVTVWDTLLGDGDTALCFDDGFMDIFDNAYPIMAAYGFRATVFVPTAFVGTLSAWPEMPGVQLMDWEQLRILKAAGWEIGSHGHTHQPLKWLPQEEISNELRKSYRLLSGQIGIPRGIAYPYGVSNEDIRDMTRCWYDYGAGAEPGSNNDNVDLCDLRRMMIGGREWASEVNATIRHGV